MSITFTKLFSSITESTIWCESSETRIVWITMLAMADKNGRVWASVPGLANRAQVSLPDAQEALKKFLSPDEHSRTTDHEGRRIEPIDGGWRLLNHAKYRAVRDDEERKAYKREWIKEKRKADKSVDNVDNVDQSRPMYTHTEAEAEAEADINTKDLRKSGEKQNSKESSSKLFEEFWSVYPKKKDRKKTLLIWKRRNLDEISEKLIADVKKRIASDSGWQDGYIPLPTTYLNGDRWEDDISSNSNPGGQKNIRLC